MVIDMSIKMISFDTSTRTTGYCLFLNGKISRTGIIASKGDNPVDGMLKNLADVLNEFNPDIVVVENTVVTRNARVQRDLTLILGGIRFWCITNAKCFFSLNPTEWRRLVREPSEVIPKKRDELKEWSIKKASAYMKNRLTSNDISDAVLIGIAYINIAEQVAIS